MKQVQSQNNGGVTNSTVVVKQIGSNGTIIQPKKKFLKKDPALYRFMNETGKTFVKLPGEIAGEQFVVQNCIDCIIYLLDFSNTVYVDDCVGCQIYIGPVESSVFVRDCYRSKFVIACGQFRSRQCEDIKILLMCQSQPIIESSLRMGFGCFRAAYPQLPEQLISAGIDPWNNTWSNIFDFTKNYKPKENHFYLLSEDKGFDDMLPPIFNVYSWINETYELNLNHQAVPFTQEVREKHFYEEVLLIFYPQFSKNHDINKLIQVFQPLPNQQQLILVEEEKSHYYDEVVIDGSDILPFFLVKAKHSMLYPENYDQFKIDLLHINKKEGQKLLDELLIKDKIQRLCSLHIRTEDKEVNLVNYLRSTISQHLNEAPLNQACLVFTDKNQIQQLGNLVFANMSDEKGDKQPNPHK